MALLTLGSVYLFGYAPIIKSITLLFFVNLVILLFWFLAWEAADDADDLTDSEYYPKIKKIHFVLFTCGCLTLFWIINPWLEGFRHYNVVILVSFVAWLTLGITILKKGAKHIDKAV